MLTATALSPTRTAPTAEGEDFQMQPAEADPLFARERLLDGWNEAQIAAARVMVVGAGALGNEVLKNLALLGFRHLFIVDMDTVAPSNLSRAVLFRPGDSGRHKVAVAARRTRHLCVARPARVRALSGDVTLDLGSGVGRRMDVVLGCLDNVAARLATDALCWLWGVPWVEGGIAGYGGSVTVFVPPGGPCYRCTLSAADRRMERERYSCEGRRARLTADGQVPAIQTGSSVIAATQVQEALKLLAGERTPRTILYDGRTNTMQQSTMGSLADHALHHPTLQHRPIRELAALRQTTRLGEAVALLEEALGGGPVSIRLDHPFVTAAACARCGYRQPVGRSLPRIWADEYTGCARCGADRTDGDGTIRLVQQRTVGSATPALADLTLGGLGIPPLHVLQVQAGGTTHYVEMTGDLPGVLGRWGTGKPRRAPANAGAHAGHKEGSGWQPSHGSG